MTHTASTSLDRGTLWIMAAATGLVVANNYYNQPLLVEFAKTFGVAEAAAGPIAVLTQAGYALGLLVFVPLGDKIERRKLIRIMLVASAFALLAMALAPSLAWLSVAAFLVGFTSIVPQLLTPFAAHLAGPTQRGHAVGTVMFGLLCGILLSRTVSGFVGAHFGWRTMYVIATLIMVALVLILHARLPKDEPAFRGSYGSLMASLWTMLRTERVVRETSAIGALHFGAFSAFWTTLAFHLHAMPQQYGSDVAGLFGLVGVLGASVASYAGKLADRQSPRIAVLAASIVNVVGFAIFAGFGGSLWGLALGVIVLDLAMQAGHVSNMTRNMGVNPEGMSRTNTLYMCIRFTGGALGSAFGAQAWHLWGWLGVCGTGALLCVLAIGVLFLPGSKAEPA
ncbi:MFS transporter [Terrihabitans sp. B22-R8]|uniref:MFS transporter n=1 Tax=Terrihabitans sp. B22-R8 TaxID=3425128 RepID=UPI00403C3BA9